MDAVFAAFQNGASSYTPLSVIHQSGGREEECIFEAEDKRDGSRCAVKTTKLALTRKQNGTWDLDIGSSNVLFECRFASLAEHPNILKAREIIIEDSFIFMVTPKYRYTLDEALMQKNFSNSQKIKCIFQLVSGVYYMHSNGFVHCDIKPQNILLDASLKKLVLCDFGLSSYAEDTAPRKPFQSLAYRSPEHISPRDMKLEKYRTDFGMEQKIDYRLSELWSVGIVCLEILYNTHGIAFSKVLRRCKLFPEPPTAPHNYENFIDLLSMLHQPKKYEKVAGMDTYTLIKKVFGRVHADLDPLLKLVCTFFLPLELYQRSLHYFLYSSYFSNHRLINKRIPFLYPDVISMYVSPINVDISKKATGILVDWLYGISEEYRMYPIVVMNAVDYIIQRTDVLSYFGVTIYNYQLFGACVFWIMCRLVNFVFFINLSALKELCCDEYSIHQFAEMIEKICAYEKGFFYFDCIYNYLPSEELMEKAMWIQSNIEDYLLYPNPKKLALSLIEKESVKDICQRTPKEFREYVFFQKKKEEADSYLSCSTNSKEEIMEQN